MMETIEDKLQRLNREINRRDVTLAQSYVAGLLVAAMLLAMPFHLTRVGALIMIVSLLTMLQRVRSTRQRRDPQPPQGAPLNSIRARFALNRSLVHNLPFLVGANLAFMGMPLSPHPEFEAGLDCLFLGLSSLLFALCYVLNQIAFRQRLNALGLRQSGPGRNGSR